MKRLLHPAAWIRAGAGWLPKKSQELSKFDQRSFRFPGARSIRRRFHFRPFRQGTDTYIPEELAICRVFVKSLLLISREPAGTAYFDAALV